MIDSRGHSCYNGTNCIVNAPACCSTGGASQDVGGVMTTPIVPTPESANNLKLCAKCGEWKPLDQFNKVASTSEKLRGTCKKCSAKRDLEYARSHPEKSRDRQRRYRDAHPDKVRERKRQYAKANQERARERGHRWHLQNPESRRERYLRWKQNNPEKYRERREKYRRNNPDVVRAYHSRRRARKLDLLDSFTAADWQYAVNHFGGHCAVCGQQPGLWHTLAADHWIPLASPDCPGTVAWNIVPLCHATKDGAGGCNNSKGSKPPAEWLAGAFGKRKGRAILKRIERYLESRRPALAESE